MWVLRRLSVWLTAVHVLQHIRKRAHRGHCLYLKRAKLNPALEMLLKKTMVLNVRTSFIKAEVSHPFGRTKISELWEWEGHQGPGLRGWSVHPGPLNRHREWGHFQHWGRSALPYSQWKINELNRAARGKKRGSGDVFGAPESRKQCGDRKRNGKRKARGRGEKQLER